MSNTSVAVTGVIILALIALALYCSGYERD